MKRTEEGVAIGLVVNSMRREQGMTIGALALKAGLTVDRLLAGEEGFGFRDKDLIRLARHLGTTVDTLKGKEGVTGLEALAPFRALKEKLNRLPRHKQIELCTIFYQSFLVAEGQVVDGLGKERQEP